MATKRRQRPQRSGKSTAMAQLRGYWEPQDLAQFHHTMSGAVEKAMKGIGLEDRFNEEQVFEAWLEFAEPFVAQNARPIALDRKVLYIQVLHSSIHYELERSKSQILAKMQQQFGRKHIRDVRFRLG